MFEHSPVVLRAAIREWQQTSGMFSALPDAPVVPDRPSVVARLRAWCAARPTTSRRDQQTESDGAGFASPNSCRPRRPTQVPASAAKPQTQPDRLPEAMPAR